MPQALAATKTSPSPRSKEGGEFLWCCEEITGYTTAQKKKGRAHHSVPGPPKKGERLGF